MEVVGSNYMPGDPRLIDHIVYELKSQGIFDNFRKECIADVDTKPAYQNLRQRVEGSVSGFLKTQRWRPDMNKNHVREMLRKNISESGFLETGVERIVDQVVNPKINSIFLPQVENVVYKFLGIQKPSAFDDLLAQKDMQHHDINERPDSSNNNLLPSDLETVSPESEPHERKLDMSNESQKLDDKIDEDESPPFEPLEDNSSFVMQEENSIDSHLSGFSGLASHDSNHSFDQMHKITPMEISNQDSQFSKQSSDDHLSIVMSDETETKMEINEDSSQSKISKATDSNSKSFDFMQDTQSSSDKNLQSIFKVDKTDFSKKVEDKVKSEERKSEKHRSSDKHKSRHDSKSESRDRKNDKDRKSDRDKKEHRDRSKHGSRDGKDKDRDRKDSRSRSGKDEKDGDSKTDKEHKHEKERDRSKSSSSRHNSSRDKSSSKKDSSESKPKDLKTKESEHKDPKIKESENKDSKLKDPESKDSKGKDSKSKESSAHKDSKTKDTKSRDDSKSKSDAKSHSSSKSKGDSKNHSKHNGKSKSDSSGKSDEKSNKNDDKHVSRNDKYSSSSKKDDKKDLKKESKKIVKDDHYGLKIKNSNRRSTDRDSSDGHSGTQSSSSSFADSTTSSQVQKSSQDTTRMNSSSGESGNSDKVDANTTTTEATDISAGTTENVEEASHLPPVHQLPPVKLIKPKFASNIFEARRLMKIRKKLGQIEKQNQLINALNTAVINENVSNHVLTYKVVNVPEKEEQASPTETVDELETGENSKRRPNILKKQSRILKYKNKMKPLNHHRRTYQNRKNAAAAKLSTPPEDKKLESEEEAVVEAVEVGDDSISAPLTSAVVSQESWDALEAKLNSENVLKIDYNSYSPLPSESHESESNTKARDEDDDCLGFSEDLISESQRYLEAIYALMDRLAEDIKRTGENARSRQMMHDKEVATATNTIGSMEVDKVKKRLPKVAIVDVTSDNEIVILPNRAVKRNRASDHTDIHNNNRIGKQLEKDRQDEKLNHTMTATKTNTKAKKAKIVDGIVNQLDNFNLPLSPAESDKSFGEKRNEKDDKTKRNSNNKAANNFRNQRYSSDDLYKPRLQFSSSRRRATQNAERN